MPAPSVAELGNILADSECQQLLLAKMMGYLLILGSLSVKAPQVRRRRKPGRCLLPRLRLIHPSRGRSRRRRACPMASPLWNLEGLSVLCRNLGRVFRGVSQT